jgi:hypothetical protein
MEVLLVVGMMRSEDPALAQEDAQEKTSGKKVA